VGGRSLKALARPGTRRFRLGGLAVVTFAVVAGCGAPRTDRGPAATGIEPVTIERLHGLVAAGGDRLVLLNVWATWCAPCREEFPDLLRIRREYEGRGVRLLLVSADFPDQQPAAERFLAAQGVDFLTYIKQGADMPFIDGLDPRWSGALPATVLYDGSGRSLWFHEGKTSYDSLKVRIEAALATSPPAGR